MKASNVPMAYLNKVNQLADVVPLNTPYSLLVTPSNLCDFRCKYCYYNCEHQQVSKANISSKLMTLQDFKILAAQIGGFNEPLKQITFAGRGEPLINKNLPDMISIIKERGLALHARVVTNANRLTNEFAKQLINAGLDSLAISLQGLSSKKYGEICGAEIDFDKFYNQVKYFSANKQKCILYAKIIDIALDEGDETKFHELFDEICDYTYVEKCLGQYQKDENKFFNKYGKAIARSKTCPWPFYRVSIEYNGDVSPCCNIMPQDMERAVIGNIHTTPLKDIWEGHFKALQLKLLRGEHLSDSICYDCDYSVWNTRIEDRLDDKKDEIIKRYTNHK